MISIRYTKQILNQLFGAASFTPPATLQLALFKGIPEDNEGNFLSANEVFSNGYARVTINNDALNFATLDVDDATVSLVKTNLLAVSYPVALASWGTVTHLAILDGDDNLLYYVELTEPQTVEANERVLFDVGSIDFTLT